MDDLMRKINDGVAKMLAMAIRLATAVGIVVLILVALVGTLDVLTTRFLDHPIAGAIKLSEAGLVLILFLGIAAATFNRSHVRVDILVTRLTTPPRRVCHAIACLFSAAFFALWTWQVWFLAAQSWTIRETATGLLSYPLYPIKFILFLGLLIAMLESWRQLFGSLNKIFYSDKQTY
jgi:TRAP-type C4-dicarboxylate transport system permease small subunit